MCVVYFVLGRQLSPLGSQRANALGGCSAVAFLLQSRRLSHWPDRGTGAIPRKGGARLRNYELMTVFRPDLEDDALQAAVERLNGLIVARGGEIASSDTWDVPTMSLKTPSMKAG